MGFGGDRRLCFPQSLGVRGGSLQVECRERAFKQPETGCRPGGVCGGSMPQKARAPVAAEEGGDDGGRVTQFHRQMLDADDLNVQVTAVLVLRCGDLVDQCGVVMNAGGGGEDEPDGIEAPRRRDGASCCSAGRSGIVNDGSPDRTGSDGLQPADLIYEPATLAVLANDVQPILLLAPPPVHVNIAGRLN